ncbi:MAG: hypothetical protein WBD36_08140 [Bacteroidota bacterium]
MKKSSELVAIIVLINTILSCLYYYAHEKTDMYWTFAANGAVIALLIFGPLIAAVLLYTRYRRPGAIIFLGTLPAALVFNLYARWSGPPPQMPPELLSTTWQVLYHGSFFLLTIVELVGTGIGMKLLQEIHAQDSQPRN